MTGWRCGWAAGNKQAVEVLGRLKSNIDSGVFQAVQYAAIAGLNGSQECLSRMNGVYRRRRDMALAALKDMGWDITPPKATFYLWLKAPDGFTSESFAEHLIDRAGVVVTPGTGYGKYGEGYFRVSLTVADPLLQEALQRLKSTLGKVTFG
jgi:LL-diaminopimelate aminotransferase